MISLTHEVITIKISDSIKAQLAAIQKISSQPTTRLIESIQERGHAGIELYGSKGIRQPDTQFAIKGDFFAGIAIEMACSQSFESLQ